MATWKEKGVVLDSDDEDFLDSQSNAELEDLSNGQRHNESNNCHDENPEDENRQNVERAFGHQRSTMEKATGSAQDTAFSSPSPKRASMADVHEHAESPLSSPIFARIFKDPRALWGLESSRPSPADEQATTPTAPQEEISQSCVRLTSSMSSALSSPPCSEMSQGVQTTNSGEVETSSRKDDINPVSHKVGNAQVFEEPLSFNKRALRQRNPIQLHPYIVEQEKYRRTLQARGLKPMRLAQSPEHAELSTDGVSQESDSQEQYLEEMDVEVEESQLLNMTWNSSPPSPIPKSIFGDAGSSDGESVSRDDDDFPDIDQLIMRRNPVSRRRESKGGLKSYSRTSRPPSFGSRPQALKILNSRNRRNNIFDVPASPPTTSSPFAAITRPNQTSLSRRTSISSKDRTPTWLDDDDDDESTFGRSANLPTPATSAIKPVPDTVPINLDSDIDDPFASEPDTSVPTSSDESIQIRKVGKKIRGVLPASHLRLDQHLKKPAAPNRTQTDSLTASPAKLSLRRGVALPRQSRSGLSPTLRSNTSLPYPSEDSESNGDVDQNDVIMADDEAVELVNPFAHQRIGYAEEDDRIDAMLPSRKRQRRGTDLHRQKKMRVGSTRVHQPKITEHLVKTRISSSSEPHRSRRLNHQMEGRSSGHTSRPHKLRPPKLGILDVTSSPGQHLNEQPQFIRVAARTARSKKNQGRQSPTRKFIRLANREDTFDAQSVLQEWKKGKIQQKDLLTPNEPGPSREPLRRVSGNVQNTLRSLVATTKISSHGLLSSNNILPRRLIISRERQRTINDSVTTASTVHEPHVPKPNDPPSLNITSKRPNRPHYIPRSRPAQLESSELEYSYQHPTTAFRSTKKALDSLYRSVRKRANPQINLQLRRFLADDGLQAPVETKLGISHDGLDSVLKVSKVLKSARKRPPHRLDIGAALYRQPSEPLVLELLTPPCQDVSGQDNKLVGLGKFGTQYPIHFDIFPLQAGIFFHESTFIGSGRLSAAVKNTDLAPSGAVRSSTSFIVAGKEFQWGPWDENVSSEIGLCFDWLAEQFNPRRATEDFSSARDTAEVVATVIDYVQLSLVFRASEDRLDFLTRMLEVVNDLLSRINRYKQNIGLVQDRLMVEVMSRCSVLALLLLRISRHHSENLPTASKLEDLLVDVSRFCMMSLLDHGVEDIRKLYDDLQYLSFREKGIRDSQYTSHAWVVLLKVLDAAQIPRKSFWDVANTQLVDKDMTTVNDARMMENLWYTMFTLLPLCEFDETGVVIQEARQTASFDNWWLPQQMLKRVFALYSSNSRQSPTFNNYCRTIVGRCHFLIIEWGWWKCSGMIGTLFDFFASQNLAHLRNEEVHKSPHFLEHLSSQPSLAVEPEDRCFHIFLKIVALGIKHMNSLNHGRDIRNLVTRLLPNHNRQYPKEDEILERELAALRNHHDLLCTLYWVAPPDHRPSLGLIQDLVEPDRSHNAACLINLRSWNQLARFVLESPDSQTSFEPFIFWQNTFFTKLWEQYLQEDYNTRRQADLHAALGAETISETHLQRQISVNRMATMTTLRMVLRNMSDAITLARNDSDLSNAFNTKPICDLLAKDADIETCIPDLANLLMQYMDRINGLRPYTEPPHTAPPNTTEDDSQNSLTLDMTTNMERQVLISPLCTQILPGLSKLTRKIIDSHLYPNSTARWLPSLIECWVRLASFASEETFNVQEFLPGGRKAVFVNRTGGSRINKYWPLFLAKLVQFIPYLKLYLDNVFDIDLEWLLVLTLPVSLQLHEEKELYAETLSRQLQKHGSFLIRGDVLSFSPLTLLKGAIKIMREVHQDSKKGVFRTSSIMLLRQRSIAYNVDSMDTKGYFSAMLKEVMNSMQRQLEATMPGSLAHSSYLKFSREVISYIRSRASNIQPLTKFFTTPSAVYSPNQSDPNLYADGLIAYSLRLVDDDPGRVSAELFHYMWRGWRNAFINGNLEGHIAFVAKGLKTNGLKYFGFLEFMLSNFIPAVLEVGFDQALGWLVARAYLPALANQILYLLRQNSCQAEATFIYVVNLLKIITNGLVRQSLRSVGNIKGAHPMNRGIIAVSTEFWISIHHTLQYYAAENPGSHIGDFYEVTDALEAFAQQTISKFGSGEGEDFCMGPLTITQGPHVERFITMLKDDIGNSWIMDLRGIDEAMELAKGSMDIRDLAPNQHRHYKVELNTYWGPTLSDILRVGYAREMPPSYVEAVKHDEQRQSSNLGIATTELGRMGGEIFF